MMVGDSTVSGDQLNRVPRLLEESSQATGRAVNKFPNDILLSGEMRHISTVCYNTVCLKT